MSDEVEQALNADDVVTPVPDNEETSTAEQAIVLLPTQDGDEFKIDIRNVGIDPFALASYLRTAALQWEQQLAIPRS